MLDDFHIGVLGALQTNGFQPKAARLALRTPERFVNLSIAQVIEALLSLRPGEGAGAAAAALRLVAESGKRDIRTLSLDDNEYPAPLRELSDAPPFIFALGEFPTDWSRALAVVGTREPDASAVRAAREPVLAAPPDAVIVSGLALGVDAAAHTAALDAQRATVAVLAHGLDTVYPKQHARLAQRIVSEGGCLISEYPVGTGVQRGRLIARDRLQSALSRAVFVVQTAVDGGTMHSARFARRQGRVLIALRPPGSDPAWSGNAQLLQAGPSGDARLPGNGPHALAVAPTAISAFIRAAFDADFVPKARRLSADGLRPS